MMFIGSDMKSTAYGEGRGENGGCGMFMICLCIYHEN
jgi:hypothetical protein